MNCRARYVTSRDLVSIVIAVHALRWDRPVRRLLPHIIQLEIAIVRPERWLDDPRDEGACSGYSLSLFSAVVVALLLLDDAPPGACVVVARHPRVAICHSRP